MPRPLRLLTRRVGPLGLALTIYDIWRRLPPRQRRWLLQQTRRHGPRVATQLLERGRTLRAKRAWRN